MLIKTQWPKHKGIDMMTTNFEESLLKATDLELNQRDRYVKSFENEYRVSHPLDALVEATSKDIGNKALLPTFQLWQSTSRPQEPQALYSISLSWKFWRKSSGW